jgi:hypothetical protein
MSRDYLWKDYTCGYHCQVEVLRCVLIWLIISFPPHHGVHGWDPRLTENCVIGGKGYLAPHILNVRYSVKCQLSNQFDRVRRLAQLQHS